MSSDHYRRLESMYLAAPINQFYEPKIEISEGEATSALKSHKSLQNECF